ncbi:PAS domain S-box/diguanylate cyclase (GGDEF) domain-containing protein [Candidatus Desulfosporosinus infrequens]|uniref:PAS domain S-box/diguanylate cyclase (GGDEF) domain-containing protein n=1 Tax=Candidatus Desulfosporosinus infrequens TaxID=2043169 RepID=A0A2U3KLL3_9FIRM|nr:PAS domain S-box/diguanylate cyclase (GGDEF) domain-containing protein [Candidatus Desulfosporosinus infrequens]
MVLPHTSRYPLLILTTLRDITQLKYMEQRESILYGVSQRVLAEKPLSDTLQYICDELVQTLGYQLAVIGLIAQDGSVNIIAQTGLPAELLSTIHIRWDDTPDGQGGFGKAIRFGLPQIHIMSDDPLFTPWWPIYELLSLRSMAAFPLQIHNQRQGVLALYSGSEACFDPPRVAREQSFADQVALAFWTAEDRGQLCLLNTALEAVASAIIITDRAGKIIWANPAFAHLSGNILEEVLGKNLSFLHSDYQDHAFYERMWQTILAGQIWHGELINRHADGTLYNEEMTITPVRAEDQEITHFIAVKQDVTQRVLDEKRLWLEKERAQVTLASIGDAVLTTDVQGNVTYLNPVAETMTGWTNKEAQGIDIECVFDICHEITGQSLAQPVRQCLREQRTVALSDHAMLRQRGGRETLHIEDTATPIRDRDQQMLGVILVFHDVSEKQTLLRRLSHQIHHDVLTDLPNRLLFKERAHQAILQARRRQEQVGVLFLDLDDFKLVNDTLGYDAGDDLLCQVGERIKRSLHQEDTVARQGGDEFLILLSELPSEQYVAQVAQKLLATLSAPFQLGEQKTYLTASLGISIYPVDGEYPEILIQNADIAMHQAKAEGCNHYHFYTLALNKRLSERLTLQNELRQALERQEFVLYYQPQYCLSNGHITGVEALVRWQHPKHGFLPPGEFIQIAEDSGLILPLGEWVLRTACTQNKHWQDLGYPPIRVAVNLSAYQFRQKDLVSQVVRMLDETGLAPKWLELEITESLSMENVDLSVETLRKLQSMGIHISLDDFGTGFSSLSFLSRFPLNTIKIDRSFITELNHHTDGQAIVLTIIQLAQNLGLKVIAEGVETEAQLDSLRTKGCDEVQGFLLAKPVSAENMVAYLEENSSAVLN